MVGFGFPSIWDKKNMKFNNCIGVYKLTGRALHNYKIMQLRPKYKRYKLKLKFNRIRLGLKKEKPISFDDFCELYFIESKNPTRCQTNLFNFIIL